MDSLIQQLRESATRLSAPEFALKFTAPTLALLVPDNEWSDVGFDTSVRSLDQIVAAHEQHEREEDEDGAAEEGGLLVRFVEKSSRNPYADRIAVGRAASCDVVIRHASVSKLHAHFVRIGAGWGIRDASSKNGVLVNQVRVGSTAPAPIKIGDHLRVGALDGRFVDAVGLYAILRRNGF